jgi:hypothetical protein
MGYRLEPISVENIGMGRLIEKANEGLSRIAQDAVDRPRNKKPRKLTVEVEIAPNQEEEGDLNLPDVAWSVKWSMPGEKGVTARGIVQDGKIMVNQDDPDPRQPVLFDLGEARQKKEAAE